MNKNAITIPLILISIIYASFFIFSTLSYGSIIILSEVMCLFFYFVWVNRGVIRVHISFFAIYMLMFSIFCMLSSFWAYKSEYAIDIAISIVEILVCMHIIYELVRMYASVDLLLKALLWGGIIVSVYIFLYYGIDTILIYLFSGARISSEVINSNTLGIMVATSILVSIYYWIFFGFRWWNIAILPIAILIIVSGSRKAIVYVVLGIFLLFLIKNSYNKSAIKSMLKNVGFILIAIIMLYFIIQLPMFSMINARMQGLIASLTGVGQIDHSTLVRNQMIQVGLDLFSSNPIIGVGMDNARFFNIAEYSNTYLHNNYIEILANGGIVGFLVYYSLHIYILVSYIKTWKYRDEKYTIGIVLLLLLLIMDYGKVSYYYKENYFYLLCCYCCLWRDSFKWRKR